MLRSEKERAAYTGQNECRDAFRGGRVSSRAACDNNYKEFSAARTSVPGFAIGLRHALERILPWDSIKRKCFRARLSSCENALKVRVFTMLACAYDNTRQMWKVCHK